MGKGRDGGMVGRDSIGTGAAFEELEIFFEMCMQGMRRGSKAVEVVWVCCSGRHCDPRGLAS